jgi:ubiquinone/menaquinone biosynthesis C-methylase UbiE
VGDRGQPGRDYWERYARQYDRSLSTLSRSIPRVRELTVASVRGRSKVLEVAAGTGMLTGAIAGSVGELVATDYAEAMIEALRRRVDGQGLRNVRCEQADLYALPYESASFDAVVAANVLHLVPDLPGALASLRRVLRPEGRLVVPTFCHDETLRSALVSRVLALTGFPSHRRFTSRSLRDALVTAGLVVERTETVQGLIPIAFVEGYFAR